MVTSVHDDVDYTKLATPAEKKKYAKQNSLMYGGLIAIGVIILQGFLTASPLGVSGRISMIAFAISLPLLAVLLMLDEWQSGEQAPSPSMTDDAAKAIALLSSLVGVVAAFWHIDWSAGVAVIAAGVVALGVYGTHFSSTSFSQAVPRRNQQRSAASQVAPVTTTPQPTGPQPTASQPFAPPPAAQSSAPRPTTDQPETPRTATPEPTTPESTAPESSTPQTTPPEAAAHASAASKPTTPEPTAPEPTATEHTAQESTASPTTPPEAATPASAASKPTTPEPTAPEPTATEHTAQESTASPTTAPETTAPASAASKPTTPEPPAGSRGLLALPYFAGERTPLFDPDARGIIAGLSLGHGRAELYRAVLEGIAYGVRHNLEAMAGGQAPRLVAVGGGTKGGLWTQIVSDVTGLPQQLPADTVGACLGDALLAAEAVGVDTADWNPIIGTVEPDAHRGATYASYYGRYRALYEATADIAHFLAAEQHRSAHLP
ncbi:FGGY-family carbohydrate kinase [Nocardia sp. CA-135953]|uniref:xylulokinase n=1 Tax=Nocardia sp. CA-135953 TaxID=3239978 RepID=UPI003D972013